MKLCGVDACCKLEAKCMLRSIVCLNYLLSVEVVSKSVLEFFEFLIQFTTGLIGYDVQVDELVVYIMECFIFFLTALTRFYPKICDVHELLALKDCPIYVLNSIFV